MGKQEGQVDEVGVMRVPSAEAEERYELWAGIPEEGVSRGQGEKKSPRT